MAAPLSRTVGQLCTIVMTVTKHGHRRRDRHHVLPSGDLVVAGHRDQELGS